MVICHLLPFFMTDTSIIVAETLSIARKVAATSWRCSSCCGSPVSVSLCSFKSYRKLEESWLRRLVRAVILCRPSASATIGIFGEVRSFASDGKARRPLSGVCCALVCRGGSAPWSGFVMCGLRLELSVMGWFSLQTLKQIELKRYGTDNLRALQSVKSTVHQLSSLQAAIFCWICDLVGCSSHVTWKSPIYRIRPSHSWSLCTRCCLRPTMSVEPVEGLVIRPAVSLCLFVSKKQYPHRSATGLLLLYSINTTLLYYCLLSCTLV